MVGDLDKVDYGFSASQKIHDLERRIAVLEKVLSDLKKGDMHHDLMARYAKAKEENRGLGEFTEEEKEWIYYNLSRELPWGLIGLPGPPRPPRL